MTDEDPATWRDSFGIFSDEDSGFAEYALNAEEGRNPEDILNDLNTFLNECDTDAPLPSMEELRDDYHARRHWERLERLDTD
jgi:hypothetical protein